MRLVLVPLLLATLAFVAPARTQAAGEAEQTLTVHENQVTSTFTDTDLCGTLYTLTQTETGVYHITIRPGGSYDRSTSGDVR